MLIIVDVFISNLFLSVQAADYLGAYDQSTNFGIANDFNLFILGNHTQSHVDSEGRVAVGGNATYSDYAVGSKLERSSTRADLIIGGNVNITSAQNLNGNTVISTKSNIINYGMDRSNGVNNPIRADIIDFAAAGVFFENASQAWSKCNINGISQVKYGQLILEGTNPDCNVFLIDGNNVEGSGLSLDTIYQINIIVPEGSTALINIKGNNIGFGNYAIFYKGLTATTENGQYYLWNFYEATSLWNNNLAIKGSVLAPKADWSQKDM